MRSRCCTGSKSVDHVPPTCWVGESGVLELPHGLDVAAHLLDEDVGRHFGDETVDPRLGALLVLLVGDQEGREIRRDLAGGREIQARRDGVHAQPFEPFVLEAHAVTPPRERTASCGLARLLAAFEVPAESIAVRTPSRI